MENYLKVLQFLIDNPSLDAIDHTSKVCVKTFKELHDQGLVEGIDVSGDTSLSFEFLEPRISLTGRRFLAESV
ncbi:hypothetical protein [Photobacterium leiognathi]|uniref:hypothetical protein n=1 Tax=Photobacterium leiognathi TaxID=553611 RepID=UPI003DA1AE90